MKIMNIRRFSTILSVIIFIIITNISIAEAKSGSIIFFKDKHLYNELCKYYNWKSNFTKEDAGKLTKKDKGLFLEKARISDLEGLQYFKNITTLYLNGNNLKNIKPLSKLNQLRMLVISDSMCKGKEFESNLETAGIIKNLYIAIFNNDGLNSLNFLSKIGYMHKYDTIEMSDNKIVDISVLKNATNLNHLDLSNNRIQDVSALAKLDKLTYFLDLRDNCIIDYTPVRHLFDEMYKDFDEANNMPRYDYYVNPFNFKFNGKMIDFPYLTAYYKYQAYAEAKPLFKAFGGSAKYDKKTGKLTCVYNGDTYVFSDFSESYTINGKSKKMDYPMRRMQYDLAYVPVEDICKMLGFKYTEILPVHDDSYWETYDDNAIDDPVLVEITDK